MPPPPPPPPPTQPPSPWPRYVSVGVDRLERWLAGFAERHGATTTTVTPQTVTLQAADGARAQLQVPFPPLVGDTPADLIAHATRTRRVGVLLVRRSGHAAGVFDGTELIASKVDSSYVQGTTKAGGWSQQRYARRRANQSQSAFDHAADVAARILAGAGIEALVAGGDWDAVRGVLADRRLADLPEPSGPWLTVKDPKHAILLATPEQFRAVRIGLDP